MKNISFLSENFKFLEVKFSIYLNRCVFIMYDHMGISNSHLGGLTPVSQSQKNLIACLVPLW